MTVSLVRGVVRVKPGVTFSTIAPAGFRMLQAIECAARRLSLDLTITSACDGEHSGPNDPHHRGEAYDVRTRGLTEPQKDELVATIIGACVDGGEVPPYTLPTVPRSCASGRFFAFVEAPGTVNEHIHVQLRKERVYP